MGKGIFVVGTDTNVGKTVISAGLVYLLRKFGYGCGYFKPILSGGLPKGSELLPLDTLFVKEVSGLKDAYSDMTGITLQHPYSPHFASRLEQKKIDLYTIVQKYNKIYTQHEYMIVEGCGGLMVPLNDEGVLLPQLIKELDLDVVIAARAGLGTINHTLLTLSQCQQFGFNIKGIILNGLDSQNPCHIDNVETIRKLTSVPIIGVLPFIENVDIDALQYSNLKQCIVEHLSIENVLSLFQ